MLMEGNVAELIEPAHDSQVKRVARRIHDITKPTVAFTQTARATTLARCGDVEKACKIAFSYGNESDPALNVTFLAKLTRSPPYTHVPSPPFVVMSSFVPIPIKSVLDTFTSMPKKYAPMRDGWTWELFKDAASRTSTANLLRKFVELFVNGLLPKPLWMFLSSAIMILFHKIAHMERLLLSDRSLRPITSGAVLTRFSVKTVLRMHRKWIVENILKSNHLSYAISRGVQQVILGCTVALQSNPTWVRGVFDLRNAHTDCSRGLIWQELENDPYFHFLI
jgi:hypothetical protein